MVKQKQTPVESVIDVNDRGILWYRIPEFPGYEYSPSVNMIRSLKSVKRYPFGTVLKQSNTDEYTMTNKDNLRLKVKLCDIIANIRRRNEKGYPTYIVDQFHSRNNRSFINPDNVPLGTKVVAKPRRPRKETMITPMFTKLRSGGGELPS